MATETFDALVLGGGLRGLLAGLRLRARGIAPLVLEADATPGGSLRTQRTNGFVCELGAFAFSADELAEPRALLPRLPEPIAASPAARTGLLRGATGTTEIAVDPVPLAFRTGNEELVQACRRELGPALRLGRAAAAVDHDGAAFVVRLGGEVPTTVTARELVVALPTAVACTLLGRFDPALPPTGARIDREPRAFGFFGGDARDAREAPTMRGYGILPADDLATPLAEVIFCSEVFPGRALPGRCLVRAEVSAVPPDAGDDAVLELAEAELRAWTGHRAPFGLRKLHRFAVEAPAAAAALAEAKARLRDLPRRVPGLTVL